MTTPILAIEDLHVEVEGKEILKGLSLTVERGHVHAIMGPNGSGKSTLSHTLMGHPHYQITQGSILWEGRRINDWKADERARNGLFLAFQYPMAIPGVSVVSFLREAMKARFGGALPVKEFRARIQEEMARLGIDESFATRSVNDGFSGGEKKRHEILQMALLQPKLAVLDETDSGLDIDALRIVADGINRLRNPDVGILLVTHYQRILNYVQPDYVNVMVQGQIVRSGGKGLAQELERTGYESFKPEEVTR